MRRAVRPSAAPTCGVIWLLPWGQRDCLIHGLTSIFAKNVPDASLHKIVGQSQSCHHSQASSSGNPVLCLPDLSHKCMANGLTETSRLWAGWTWTLRPTTLAGGTVALRILASLHIKASPVFSSVQENIWKICPVNSPLCSCLDFNIYLPIQSNIWWMPMGKKIRHYEKQKAVFSLFFFLFFPNRFTSMKKSHREIQQIVHCLFKRRGDV